MVLPQLQALAGELGIGGTARLRKSQLIEAIQAKQGATGSPGEAPAEAPAVAGAGTTARTTTRSTTRSARSAPPAAEPAEAGAAGSAAGSAGASAADTAPATGRGRVNGTSRRAAQADAAQAGTSDRDDSPQPARADRGDRADTATSSSEATTAATADRADGSDDTQSERVDRGRERFLEREARRQERQAQQAESGDGARPAQDRTAQDRAPQDRPSQDRAPQDRTPQDRTSQDRASQDRDSDEDRTSQDRYQERPSQDRSPQDRQGGQDRAQQQGGTQARQDRDTGLRRDEQDDTGSRRGRFRERGRNRNRNARGADRFAPGDAEPVLSDDDVLVPIGGILDILDNYGFVRTSGYLTGPNDVYVSLQQVRRYGLRRGDAVTGAVRQQREGERKDKYNALVRLDSVNGLDVEEARKRPDFTKLTPLYPQDRLRLETEPGILTTRVIDLVMPIGKGQRALIVSPPKAGKTMVMQAIANAIATNNPECHLMVVLVDERPEEVTDMQRSVKGEVIASTFDRPPQDHITVAELSIERAKRLVELGHDVVVLLDSITRLGRAYNLGAPASGRILTGGVDSAALYPPKRFLGAARNVENGGSLTIFATALVETGSAMDTVIFEEFKGTGNAELKLDRKLADKRIFPAIDVDASGTRKEEILLAPEELRIVLSLRRVLHALDASASLELLLDKMKSTRTNVEFLMQIQKTTASSE
ncbi:MAG TPA: transcription termination factor Rho [Mycobacteriales bacterium]|nr:transcription termination factor Rho [Mycobacteriales bacterium]